MASSIDEQILRAAKEIVVKFIEVGRISPAGFEDTFRNIYNSINLAVRDSERNEKKDNNT